jgi:hypothetical protein
MSEADSQRARAFEQSWQTAIKGNPHPLYFRRELAAESGMPPLGLMFLYIHYGLYPPPELLLGLRDGFDYYLNTKGTLLEDIFFGRAVRRIGNYAARSASRQRRFSLAFETLVEADRTGKDLTTAAQDVIVARGEKGYRGESLDAESVKDMIREFFKGVAGK